MKLSDYVIDFIRKQGVEHIFELTGGAIVHLLDSTIEREDVTCISMRHEQAAAFAAEGYSRISGTLGVAMGTSGPGALNLLTGIGSCYFDSIPCLFITGQVNTYEFKFEKPLRQLGFQETDIVSIVKPITKSAELVTDASMIRYQLEKAAFLAKHGRPGPVLLDIPMNIQRSEVDPESLCCFFDSEEYQVLSDYSNSCAAETMESIICLLKQAQRPLILVGGGVRGAGAVDELRDFVRISGIPVVGSLMGLDALPATNSPLNAGLIGSYGNRYSNIATANCDLVLILGSRLDTRQTGTKPSTFARGAKKIHVDIDPVELNAKVSVDIAVRADVKKFLAGLNQRLAEHEWPNYVDWVSTISDNRIKYPSGHAPVDNDRIDPNHFMQWLSSRCSERDIIVLDVGQHQMWASQSFHLQAGQRLLNAGGMGAMGFALPAAIGAAMAAPESTVIVIAGDGGIQLNIQELHTVVQHRLAIKIIVMNNGNLGMVRQFQDMYFDGRRQSTVEGYGCPDLTRVAEAYGFPATTITNMKEAVDQIDQVLHSKSCYFVNVMLDMDTNVTPKLAVNRPIEDMHPLLPRDELKKALFVEMLDIE